MELKRSKVVRLPTEEKTLIGKSLSDKLIYIPKDKFVKTPITYQHLYFTTDDEIKKEDWVFMPKVNRVVGYDGSQTLFESDKKIVASTDPELTSMRDYHGEITSDKCKQCYNGLPQPSKAFIEKYCKVGGIDEVMIECEPINYNKIGVKYSFTETSAIGEFVGLDTRIKIDSHNTIIIHPIKNSQDREEITDLIRKFRIEILIEIGKGSVSNFTEKWIEKNL